MSISCLSSLFRRGDHLKSSDYQVLMALCFFLRRDEIKRTGQASCWPSTPVIAKKAHLSEKIVRKSLKSLEELGLISISNPFSRNRVITIRLSSILDLGEDSSCMQCTSVCSGYPDKCEECFVRDSHDVYQYGTMELADCLLIEKAKEAQISITNPCNFSGVDDNNTCNSSRVDGENPCKNDRVTPAKVHDKQDIEQEINKKRKKEKKEICEQAEVSKKVIPIKPTRKRTNKTLCPFELNSPIPDEYRQCAEEITTVFRPQLQFEKFVAYHTSKGNTFANWKAAFRNWMLKAVDFAKQISQPPQGSNHEKRTKAFGHTTKSGPSQFEPRYDQIDYTIGATTKTFDYTDEELNAIDF